MKNNFAYVGILAVLIIAIGGIFLYVSVDRDPSKNAENGAFFDTSIKSPDIYKELTFPADFPEDGKTAMNLNMETLRSAIEENPANFGAWLDLAIQYKTVDDIDFAVEIWEYLARAVPSGSVSFQNLGSTYHFFLKDFKKSEKNYKKAIEISPEQSLHYMGLHELYKYSYKQDTSLAADILLEGIENTPNPVDLMNTLARYYGDQGDNENAIKYFEKTLDEVIKLGNQELADQIQGEIEKLQ